MHASHGHDGLNPSPGAHDFQMKSRGPFLLAPVLALTLALSAVAADPPSAPILRVETGMHTTLIRRIATDVPRNRIVTCSDDKTVRVWQMPQARLVATLRVPIGAGHEGQLFAVAVSPDGRTAAAGGWTGWEWDGSASVYLFDIESGELVRRIGGFRDAIGALAFAPDGRHLAVGLQARAGLHVLRLTDGRVVASDTEYSDKIMDIDFNASGRMAVAALDGMLRLYTRDFRLAGRRGAAGGNQLASVRFSPSGTQLALGYADAPTVAVVAARDLSLRFHPQGADGKSALPGQASFSTVAWSADGRYLLAGGDYAGPGPTPLARWDRGGEGPLERIPIASQRVSDLQQMAGNKMVYAAEDPQFGLLAADGRVLVRRSPDIADFAAAHGRIEIAPDGMAVRYPLRHDGSMSRSFSLAERGEQPQAERTERVHPPVTEARGLRITGLQPGGEPRLNGKPLLLDDHERPRSHAYAADGSALLLGTEWALRLYDREARLAWRVPLPAVAYAVNVARQGKVAVAALSDGTIRWYRMRDGREMLAYFPHAAGREWIAWTPEGYYMSSTEGDNYVGWHLNRGRDRLPDFFRAVQFERVLYRPDRVRASFLADLQPHTRSLSGEPRFEVAQLADILPPRLKLRAKPATGKAWLTISGEQTALAMHDYTVFVNGIPVTPGRERRLEGEEARRFTRSLEIELDAPENEIRVEAFNGVSMGVAVAYVVLDAAPAPRPQRGDLYVLAIGTSTFAQLPPQTFLPFAARDSVEMAAALARNGAGHFRAVHAKVLADGAAAPPTRENILQALAFLQQASAADTVLLFLASHGLNDPAGNYYFVPGDARPADVDSVRRGAPADSLVPWTVFFEALRQAAGRRILMVDTCHAANIEGHFEPYALMKRSASSQFSLVVAAKGDEESQEYLPARHGLFTYAFLTAMNPGSDQDRDGLVTLREIFDQAIPLVEELRDRTAGPQSPQIVLPAALMRTALLAATPPAR